MSDATNRLLRLDDVGVPAHPGVRWLLSGDREQVAAHYPRSVSLEGLAEVAALRGGRTAPAADLTGGALAVVTGQQAGLLGGSMLVAWKALTAIALARLATEHLGTPVVPVFWAATEDHDLDEIRTVSYLDAGGRLQKRTHRFPGETAHTPAQAAVLGAGISELVERVLADLPGTEWKPALSADLLETYTPENTAGDAFVALIRRWFGRFGLIVVEPRDVAQRCDAPIHQERAEPQAARLARAAGAQLAALGLPAPLGHGALEEEPPLSQAYGIVDGARIRDAVGEGVQPSAGAALRPAWQDLALPTIATVCGPAEVSYHGQLRAVHETHGSTFPVIWPRASGTLIDDSDREALESYGVSLREAARLTREQILAPPRDVVPPEIAARLELIRRTVQTEFEAMERDISGQQDLEKPLQRTRRSMLDNLERGARRIEERLAARTGLDTTRREKLAATLTPHGEPQERRLATLSFLCRQGPSLLDAMLAAIDPLHCQHMIGDVG